MDKNQNIQNSIITFLSNTPAEKIQEIFDKNKLFLSYYKCALMEMETKFKVLNEQFSALNDRNPIESIKTRIKTFKSIADKLERKNLPFSLEAVEQNIFDVAGIRIICSFTDDIYMLAECLEQQDDIKIIKRKDYIKTPKPNGYRSLHLLVEIPIFLQNEKKNMIVEVQLRTIAMEFWANLEHHIRYKKNLNEKTLSAISSDLKDCAEKSASLDCDMKKIRDMIILSERPDLNPPHINLSVPEKF